MGFIAKLKEWDKPDAPAGSSPGGRKSQSGAGGAEGGGAEDGCCVVQ